MHRSTAEGSGSVEGLGASVTSTGHTAVQKEHTQGEFLPVKRVGVTDCVRLHLFYYIKAVVFSHSKGCLCLIPMKYLQRQLHKIMEIFTILSVKITRESNK